MSIKVIETVISEKTNANEMFTAHDITLEVRNRGHRVSHSNVRDIVHDNYQRGNMGVAYTRTPITVPSGETPFLYHRSADDPSAYSNIRNDNTQQSSAPNTTITIPSLNDNDNDDNEEEDDNNKTQRNVLIGRKTDARGTLSIPSAEVRKLGVSVGDKVYAVIINNGIKIVKENRSLVHDVIFSDSNQYTVDYHGQVRITQSFLKKAGIGGDSFDISFDDSSTQQITGTMPSKILVKLHK